MKRILAFVDDIYEDLELWYPKLRLQEEGWEVVVAGPEAGRTYKGKNGYPCVADAAIQDVAAADFDGLLVPGGFAPDKLRRDPDVLRIVRAFNDADKPIAHICHAGWMLCSADIVRGRTATCFFSIKDDLINAGAIWEDASVIVDRHFVCSRKPDDLPEFMKGIFEVMVGVPALAGSDKTA